MNFGIALGTKLKLNPFVTNVIPVLYYTPAISDHYHIWILQCVLAKSLIY